MPEFILKRPHWWPKGAPADNDLMDFACGYVEAMFFTNGDSGRVGIVALKRSEWGGTGVTGPEREAALLEYAKNVAEEYGRWMNGECYGYTIIDPRDEGYDGGSCWGFVGFEHVENEATEALAYAAKEFVDKENERVAREIEASRPDMMGVE
jgi:hypothetical protein